MVSLTKQELQEMAEVDVRTVDINTLTELSDIEVDTSKPVAQKLGMLSAQTKNIYVTRCDDYVVKVIHQKEGPTIDDKMAEHLRRMVEIYF